MTDRWKDLSAEEREFLDELGLAADARHPMPGDCPPLDQVMAAQSGMLSQETWPAVYEHIAKCEWCRILASDLVVPEIARPNDDESARIRQRVFRGPHHRGWSGIFPMRAGYVVVLAAVLFAVLSGLWYRAKQKTATTVAVTTPKPVAQVPSAFKLEKPTIRLPAEVLVWRGASGDARRQFARDLDRALVPLRRDDFVGAQQTLRALVKKYPDSSDAYFYLAAAELYLNQDADALQNLQTTKELSPGLTAADVPWYLAIALHRTGRNGEARRELQSLCGATGTYSQQACAALAELNRK